MLSGSDLLETWIPDGGFQIERRKIKTPDGGSTITECLVPTWADDELTPDRPCARQPCLHRIVAECPLEPEAILAVAARYGLLTFSIPRAPEPGQIVRAALLPPEPVEIWRKEIGELRTCVDLWDAILAGNEGLRQQLARKVSEHLARVPFHLSASVADAQFKLRYRPLTLQSALWQRLVGEVAGLIHPARCPAPNCARWFLRGSAARSDKRFCSNACKNRVFRGSPKAQQVTSS